MSNQCLATSSELLGVENCHFDLRSFLLLRMVGNHYA